MATFTGRHFVHGRGTFHTLRSDLISDHPINLPSLLDVHRLSFNTITMVSFFSFFTSRSKKKKIRNSLVKPRPEANSPTQGHGGKEDYEAPRRTSSGRRKIARRSIGPPPRIELSIEDDQLGSPLGLEEGGWELSLSAEETRLVEGVELNVEEVTALWEGFGHRLRELGRCP